MALQLSGGLLNKGKPFYYAMILVTSNGVCPLSRPPLPGTAPGRTKPTFMNQKKVAKHKSAPSQGIIIHQNSARLCPGAAHLATARHVGGFVIDTGSINQCCNLLGLSLHVACQLLRPVKK